MQLGEYSIEWAVKLFMAIVDKIKLKTAQLNNLEIFEHVTAEV